MAPSKAGDALELVEAVLVIGLGCRRGATVGALLDVVGALQRQLPERSTIDAIATAAIKQGQQCFDDLADRTGLPLVFVDAVGLAQLAGKASVSSPAAMRHMGVPSVAEAAALFAAGNGGRLIVRRLVIDGVTGAVARGD